LQQPYKVKAVWGFCNKYNNEENRRLKAERGDKKGLGEFFGAKNRSHPAILRSKSGCRAQQVQGRGKN
jgi:hypothetical protein